MCVQRWPPVSDFPKVISILDPLYDAASLHVVYENDQQIGQRNLYTSVAYGRAADMRSVPPTLELEAYGRFTVARKRVDRATAATFIQAAMAGLATLDGYELRAPNCPNCLISRRRYGFKSTAPFPPLSVFSRLFHHHSASFAELSRICSSPSFANLARSSKGVGYCEKSTRLPSNMSLS